ncbi:hypothetical protein LB565_22415, partial [Mesorhizobium sp. CA14]|uniref:hypothetical protein n=1 Tax=Mesorhizobium sp. CA14 TaxID=2876642 RepID=UPI001CC9E15F
MTVLKTLALPLIALPGTSPRERRAVRGKLFIGEVQLVWGSSVASAAGIDRRWLVDGLDSSAFEQA